jgi:hypothetical protein
MYTAGWWLGIFFIFSYIWDVILPIDELHHFSRWLKPPTRYVCRKFTFWNLILPVKIIGFNNLAPEELGSAAQPG